MICTMYVGIPSTTLVLNCSFMNITWTTPTNVGGAGILITSYIITVYPPPSLSYSSYIEGVCNTTEEFFYAGTESITSTSMELILGTLMLWYYIRYYFLNSFIYKPGQPVGLATSVSSCDTMKMS